MQIAAKFGQPWSEAKAMSSMDRKAFLFVAHELEGYKIDWSTGRVLPKPQG